MSRNLIHFSTFQLFDQKENTPPKESAFSVSKNQIYLLLFVTFFATRFFVAFFLVAFFFAGFFATHFLATFFFAIFFFATFFLVVFLAAFFILFFSFDKLRKTSTNRFSCLANLIIH